MVLSEGQEKLLHTSFLDLLKVLNNYEEPPNKRIKIADNAFKSPEMKFKHKEAFLLKWVVNNMGNLSNEEAWSLTNKWLSSEQFKNITQNDISNDDISVIVELFVKQLQNNTKSDVILKKEIIDAVLHLCDNKVFQQYFKYNLELYCRLLSIALENIDSSLLFIKFLASNCLFSRNYLLQDTFLKHFMFILYPVLVKKGLEFRNNETVFEELSNVVQKCLFNGNGKTFETFFDQCLQGQKPEEGNEIPNTVFKYLVSIYNESPDYIAFSFKIIFHSFCRSFPDPAMIFKFLILLVQLVQFNVTDFSISWPFKVKNIISLKNALSVVLQVLDVLSTINFVESNVSGLSLTQFLRNTLMSVLKSGAETSIIYQIILKCISINPLIIESIATNILFYVMSADNKKLKTFYEKVVIAIFEVFGKLHRIENFIAKFIPALKSFLISEKMDGLLTDGYSFTGEKVVSLIKAGNNFGTSVFTETVLQYLAKCFNGLASWQVINVFLTLLYHLRTTVNEYSANDKADSNQLTFLEALAVLTKTLLKSVRTADHNIPPSMIQKLKKGLNDLQLILKMFGPAILRREHNHITMRTFLNLSYVWGETYMTLTYYSINNEVKMATVIDNTYTACNLRYLHSYLDAKQWQLISQRITNFGEHPCKKLLQKLYIQKLRAMLLFEEHFNNEITTNIVKTLQIHLEDTWKDLLLDKFAVNFVLPKMDQASLIYLSERLVEEEQLHEIYHIKDSIKLTNAVTFVVMSKINKLFKHKRKHDQDLKKAVSSKVFALIPDEIYFNGEDYNISEIIDGIKNLFDIPQAIATSNIESKEENLIKCFKIFRKFPFIYSTMNIQKIMLLYLFSLYGDIVNCSKQVKKELEDLIIGILQACKFQLSEIFSIEILTTQILKYFQRYDVLFSLIIDNVFKNENCIKCFKPLVNCLTKNLEDPKYLSSSILVLQAINKVKKSKMDSSTKEAANQYKENILGKIAKLVCKSDYFIEAYATCLKHYLSIEKDSEILKKVLDKLAAYIQYSLENINSENKKGCVILFSTVLHNKQKLKEIDEDIVLKVWNACRKADIGDEYSHLMNLIVTMIPNNEFHVMVNDLLSFTVNNISNKNYSLLARQLKIWESILTCDVNPTKMKVLQEALESVIQKLLEILKTCQYDETILRNVVHLEECIIQTQRFMVSPPLIDMFILNVSILMRKENQSFETKFNLSLTILEKLLKFRNAVIMDRLPAFLQQYRVVLNCLCVRSNSDQTEGSLEVNKASDCAHKLEKLTKNLVSCKKDMSRIAVFVIADILERYEQINLYPNVKLHLNNCIYSLISLCDHHAVSYLMRVLSSASTEMFKIMYEHYKKYYMFTGKV